MSSLKSKASPYIKKNVKQVNVKNVKKVKQDDVKNLKPDDVKNGKQDVEDCIKLLKAGNVHLIDLDVINESFSLKPNLGDYLQYELHNYCRKNEGTESKANVVEKLAQLCYSDVSVSQFKNMDRFVGCVYYITSYLLKKEVYQSALDVINSLTIKKNEIVKALETNSDIRHFLCNLHSNFIGSATLLTSKLQCVRDSNYKLSHELAIAALKCLQLCTIENVQVAKILVKKSKVYLHTIKHYKDADIVEFYETLKNVLKSLLPTSNLDGLMLFLCKMDVPKDMDMSKGSEVENHLKSFLLRVFLMKTTSLKAKRILIGILDCFFAKEAPPVGKWNFEDLKNEPMGIQLFFLLVCNIFSYGMQFWWKKYEENWNKNSSNYVGTLCRHFFDLYNSHCSNLSLYCSETKSPFETCFIDLFTGNLNKIQYTIRLCLKNKVSGSLSLIKFSRQAYKLSLECVETMSKKNCCNSVLRSYVWKHTVIHQTNLILDILKYPNETESLPLLSECCEEVLQTIVNAEYELPFDLYHVHILFQRWHYANLKLKKHLEALYICTAYYVCYPQQETDIMSWWILTKSEISDKSLEESLMFDILESSKTQLQNFNKSYVRHRIDTKALLMMELKMYSFCPLNTFQNPGTSHKLVSIIWQKLQSFNLDLCEKSFALECLVFTKIWGDEEELPKSVIEKCNKVASNLLNKECKGRKQCRSFLHAANLNFFLFLYDVKQVERSGGMVESSQLILNYLKKEQEEKFKFGDDADLNLTCNVMPSSSRLTVELETNYLKALNKVVELWEVAVELQNNELPSRFEFEIWIHTVKQAAHLYELIGEYRSAVVTWLLLYKIGKLRQHSGNMLVGLTGLLDNVNYVEASFLFTKAKSLSIQLDAEKDILVPFWLTVASNYLKNKKTDQCLEYLLKAKEGLEGFKNAIKTYVLNARFWCLVSQFLAMCPEYETDFGYPKGTSLRFMVFKAFKYASIGGQSEFVKTATHEDSIEVVLAMLKVNIWAYHFFGIYRETEHMRLFLGSLYQIVQKLFLPTRTAEILVRLAEVDILCEKASDCEEKVIKIKSILLTLPSARSGTIKKKDVSPYLSVAPIIHNKVSERRMASPFSEELVVRREADPSPVNFHLSDIQSSKYMQHANTCKCRSCQNLLVQILTMDTLTVEGEMHKLWNLLSNANACYQEAYATMTRLRQLRTDQGDSLRFLVCNPFKTDPGILGFHERLVQFHSIRFLIKRAYFDYTKPWADESKWWKTVHEIEHVLNLFSYEKKLLMWTFGELKLSTIKYGKKDSWPKNDALLEINSPVIAKTPAPVNPVHTMQETNDKKSTISVTEEKTVPVTSSSLSSSDSKNTAFLGKENLPTARKANIKPKKLVFVDPDTEVKTVKKAPKTSGSVMKPKKLNLDNVESSEKKKDVKKNAAKK